MLNLLRVKNIGNGGVNLIDDNGIPLCTFNDYKTGEELLYEYRYIQTKQQEALKTVTI